MTKIRPPTSPIDSNLSAENVTSPQTGDVGSVSEFNRVLQSDGSLGATKDVQSSQSVDSLQTLADELRSGRMNAEQAVEYLLQNTLSSPITNGLKPEQLQLLTNLMRQLLADDPTLSRMTSQLKAVESESEKS